MRPQISSCIITLNEEENLRDCLASVAWTDEIAVVDSGSTDRTLEIAREFTDRVIHHEWNGINAQRNYALTQASHEWVLCLDADERVTPELRDEIKRRLETEADTTQGYRVRRKTYFLDRWILHGGWYPDWKTRLFRKSVSRFVGMDPHDLPRVDGTVRDLAGEIIHYSCPDLSRFLRKIDSFSGTVARNWVQEGKHFRLIEMLVRPPWKWVETYILKRGFLDGLPGLIISVGSAFYVFMKYAKLWEVRRRKGLEEDERSGE